MKYIETTQAYKWAVQQPQWTIKNPKARKEAFFNHPNWEDTGVDGVIKFDDSSFVKYQKRRGKFTVVYKENYEFV